MRTGEPYVKITCHMSEFFIYGPGGSCRGHVSALRARANRPGAMRGNLLMETVSAFVGSYGMIAETVFNGTPRHQRGDALVFGLGDCVPTRDGGSSCPAASAVCLNAYARRMGAPNCWTMRVFAPMPRATRRAVLMPYITASAGPLRLLKS